MASSHRSRKIFVHHRNSGHIDIDRAKNFSKRQSYKQGIPAIHFVGYERRIACRCRAPQQHYEKTFPVAEESTHLNTILTMYLDRHAFNSCKLSDFRKWKALREAAWADQGVHVVSFHYTDRTKRTVCRCSQSASHGYRITRNPEIIEKCAEFFRTHPQKMSCSMDQWKTANNDSPPTYSPRSDVSQCEIPGGSTEDHEVFEKQKLSSRSSKNLVGSDVDHVDDDMQHLGLGLQSAPDIPEHVWHRAKPSLFTAQRKLGTDVSTPLGTPRHERNSKPLFKGGDAAVAMYPKSSPLDALLPIKKYTAQMNAADDRLPLQSKERYRSQSLDMQCSGCRPRQAGSSAGMPRSSHERWSEPTFVTKEVHRVSHSGIFENDERSTNSQGQDVTDLAELSSTPTAVELPPEPVNIAFRHSPTLRHLEGRSGTF